MLFGVFINADSNNYEDFNPALKPKVNFVII